MMAFRALLLIGAVRLSQCLRTTDTPAQDGFQIGDKVEVRDSEDESWKTGVISSLEPVKVTADGWDVPFRWRFVRAPTLEEAAPALEAQPPSEEVPPADTEEPSAEESLPAVLDGPPRPAEPGCYVWMPSGCSKNANFSAQLAWKRDAFGEASKGAGHSKAACQDRKAQFNSWCGVDDAQLLFVGRRAPTPPTAPGCYVFHPSGCPNHELKMLGQWARDVHGEERLNAGGDQSACIGSRKRSFDAWCGVDDTEMVWVSPAGQAYAAAAPSAPALQSAGEPPAYGGSSLPTASPQHPEQPGCYVWMPTGCAANSGFSAQLEWRRDEYGEANKGAGLSRSNCHSRQAKFNSWCGASDAQMLFVPRPVPAAPTVPGCYVFHTSGCVNRELKVVNRWVRDDHGEQSFNARSSQSACVETRKRSFDTWCGVDDTQMVWVGEDGSVASSPHVMEASTVIAPIAVAQGAQVGQVPLQGYRAESGVPDPFDYLPIYLDDGVSDAPVWVDEAGSPPPLRARAPPAGSP